MASPHPRHSPQDTNIKNHNFLTKAEQPDSKNASPQDNIPSHSTLDTLRKTVTDSEYANHDELMMNFQRRSSLDELGDQKFENDQIKRQVSDFTEIIEEILEDQTEQKSFTGISLSSPLLPGYEIPAYVLSRPPNGYLRFNKEEFLKDCESQRGLELKSTDDMIESHQTITEMMKNEKRWQKERLQACSVIAECKAYIQSFNPPELEKKDSNTGYNAPSNHNPVGENISGNMGGNADFLDIYEEEVLGIESNDLRGLNLNESLTTKAGSDDGRQGLSETGQAMINEIERERERMRRNDLRSVTQALGGGETMTHFILNDMKREKELKECRENIKNLVEALDKLLPKEC